MCGICGKLNLDYRTPVGLDLLERMSDAIAHRGPDGAGYYRKGPIGFGHRRLRIIDLLTGDQPISNENGTIWIVFNGEIYNYRQLRGRLESRGHHFVTKSDTEVIVHAYEEWGLESSSHLRGMFAYAIWDEPLQRLVLVRDRMGQKPLVYTHSEGAFLFASEIRALLQEPTVQREVDLEAVYAYLTRLYVPAPKTAFKNIYKLPPAHYLVVENGQIELKRYWQVDFAAKWQASEVEYRERLWELLVETTRMRLMSDVPLGAFLSGGIDSSVVVGIMSEFTSERVKTFSIRYEESDYDESAYARQIAEQFDTEHYEFTVRPNAMEVLPKLVWHYGEPFADASSLPTYYVSQLTRQHVTVALSGDAGDESFAGYERYQTARLLEGYQFLPRGVRRHMVPALLRGLGYLPGMKYRAHQLHSVAMRGRLPPEEAYVYHYSVFTPEMNRILWSSDRFAQINAASATRDIAESLGLFQGDHPLDRYLYLDLTHYLPDDILTKVDIASMANSLEVRSPFLDHHLVEFAASLPPGMKRRGLTTKYILKKTLEKFLPHDILYRHKHGFAVPVSEWLRGELRPLLQDVLLDATSRQRGYFDTKHIERLIKEHASEEMDHGTRLWTLLNLELWQRTYVDEVRDTPLTL